MYSLSHNPLPFRALTIAGSDCSGGAGIQADLKTFSALGVFGCSVISALTAQNTLGVQGIFAITPDFVAKQLESVFTDIRIDAVKIGMLADVEIIKTVATSIKQYRPDFVVLDPVMVAKGGANLLEKSAESALVKYLLPLADIITPNLPEAAALLQTSLATTKQQMQQQAFSLIDLGVKNVLLKGGHLVSNTSDDCLVQADGSVNWINGERINTKHTHGTGCTLSSAIAAIYSQQKNLLTTVQKAKIYVHQAILSGQYLNLGHGIGPLNHFYAWTNNTQ